MKIPAASRALCLALLASAPPVGAQLDPPVIVVNDAERKVRANVEADGDSDLKEIISTAGSGLFDESVTTVLGGDEGSLANGFAEQKTTIGTFIIYGSGSVDADASLGGGEDPQVFAASDSRIFVLFDVPVGSPYTLSGTL